jgi:hypothetical protein
MRRRRQPTDAPRDPAGVAGEHAWWRPRAKRSGLVRRRVGDELLVYDPARRRAFCLNATAARLFVMADGTRDVDELGRLLCGGAGGNSRAALLGLRQLERHGLLEQASGRRQPLPRRDLLRRVTGLALLPSILVLDVATSAAASCLPLGAVCSANSECCSGNCVVVCV